MDKLISQQAAIDAIKKRLFETAFNNVGIKQNVDETLVDVAENRLENWFNELPSAEPDTTTHDSIPVETGENDGDRTSGDCISRAQAIDTIEKHLKWTTIPDYYPGIFEAVRGWLNGLPSTQPKQRWIPVSERLPEEGRVVLTQAKFKDDVKMAVSSRIDYNYWTTWGTRDINIVAWMPLPERYSGE